MIYQVFELMPGFQVVQRRGKIMLVKKERDFEFPTVQFHGEIDAIEPEIAAEIVAGRSLK